MGINALSLFDGMSCGRLAFERAGVEVDTYIAAEVKDFAINHTKRTYPDTIQVGDVTRLHYENNYLYKDCKRWAIIGSLDIMDERHLENNRENIRLDGEWPLIDVVNLKFDSDFDKNNRILADYKDAGLVLNAKDLCQCEIDYYRENGFTTLPNGEIVQWENGELVYEGSIEVLIGGSPCFTGDTPVLTENGYKNIKDIEVGERVVSHDGKLHKVTAFMPQGEKHIFEINTSFSGKIRTTINHEFYVRKKDKNRVFDEPKMVAIGDIATNVKDYYVGFPINQESIIPIWEGVDTYINQTTKTRKCTLDMNDKTLWYLVGRYLGDGWLQSRKGKYRSEYSKVIICCGNNKVDDFKTKISNEFHCSVTPNTKGTYRFTFNNVELAAFMAQFGKYADGKFLPGFVYDMPVELLKSLIQGYLDADGNYIKNQNEWKLTSINKNLLLGMGALIAKVYHRPYTLTEVTVPATTVIEGRTVNQKNWYTIKWHYDERKQDKMFYEDGYIWGPIRSIVENGTEEVYDITVEDTHTFVATNVIVHNCQNFSYSSFGNDEKYGLEGSKSRLFFDYLRIRQEIEVVAKENGREMPYFFLENVHMKEDSKEALDTFMGVEGIYFNSRHVSCHNRQRIYWTNLCTLQDTEKFINPNPEYQNSLNLQNFILRTLPKYEQIIHDITRAAITGWRNDNAHNIEIVKFIDNQITETEVEEIYNKNLWVVDEIGHSEYSHRDIVNEIHFQLCEAQVATSESRFEMRNKSCKNVTNEKRMSCQLRKQDRRNNAGIINFGTLTEEELEYLQVKKEENTKESLINGNYNWYRFFTRLELCKGQTVPYTYMSDLTLHEVEDVCGDGWTVDAIVKFFKFLSNDTTNNELSYQRASNENNYTELIKGGNNMSDIEIVYNYDRNVNISTGVSSINTTDLETPLEGQNVVEVDDEFEDLRLVEGEVVNVVESKKRLAMIEKRIKNKNKELYNNVAIGHLVSQIDDNVEKIKELEAENIELDNKIKAIENDINVTIDKLNELKKPYEDIIKEEENKTQKALKRYMNQKLQEKGLGKISLKEVDEMFDKLLDSYIAATDTSSESATLPEIKRERPIEGTSKGIVLDESVMLDEGISFDESLGL